MEFNTFNGTTIKSFNIDGETVNFDVDIFDRIANIKISGVESFTGSIDNEISIEKVDIDVTDMTANTFTKVVVTTTDNKVIELLGDMKGELLNEKDFYDIIGCDDCDCDCDDDCDCDCDDDCDCDCDDDCDCDCDDDCDCDCDDDCDCGCGCKKR